MSVVTTWSAATGVLPNSALTEELDEPIGTQPLARFATCPWLGPKSVSGRGWTACAGPPSTAPSSWPVCTNGRLVGLAPIELLLAAPADAVLGLVEHCGE
jgi:hypothetical protein